MGHRVKRAKAALPPAVRKKIDNIHKEDAEQLAGAFAMALMQQAISPKKLDPLTLLVNAGGFAVMSMIAPHLTEDQKPTDPPAQPSPAKSGDVIDAEFTVINEKKR